jgi:hypothetical protein
VYYGACSDMCRCGPRGARMAIESSSQYNLLENSSCRKSRLPALDCIFLSSIG